jgi:UDP-N-acetylmuramate--alanine ligase
MTKAHIAGIGGEGWSWIAKVLLGMGWEVSGCDCGDISNNYHIKDLKKLGIRHIYNNNSPSHITPDTNYFLYTSALLSSPVNKEELARATSLGVKSFDRCAFFPKLLENRDVIAIAGTHGKTTTSAITAYILDSLGIRCGFGIGGTPLNFNTNGRVGESVEFVVEADEYANAFLGLYPKHEIITFLEKDHTEFFPTFNDIAHSFSMFVNKIRSGGKIIYNSDCLALKQLIKSSNKQSVSYGFDLESDWILSNPEIQGFTTSWRLQNGKEDILVSVPFPGKQYALNATASIILASLYGFNIQRIAHLLAKFKGTKRRFEKIQLPDFTVISDYGHHPTEIKTTLEGAKKLGKRIIVIYEPHQYKRCFDLKVSFKGVFDATDVLIQVDIFPSRELPPYPISGEEFYKITSTAVGKSKYVKDYKEVSGVLKEIVLPDDLVLVFAVGHGEQIVSSIKKLYEY